jgi:MFS family permease
MSGDVTTLATLRGIQGIGAAAMLPAGVSPHFSFYFLFSCLINSTIQVGILAHAFPPSRARSLAFATFSSGAALGAAIGNTIGGTLTDFTKYESSRTLPLLPLLT